MFRQGRVTIYVVHLLTGLGDITVLSTISAAGQAFIGKVWDVDLI